MLPIQPQQPGAAPWRKVLWFEQPYPDNHTSDWFLQALVVHEGRRRRYWRVVGAALDVDQQLCAAAAVASVAHHLRTVRGSLLALNSRSSKHAASMRVRIMIWSSGSGSWLRLFFLFLANGTAPAGHVLRATPAGHRGLRPPRRRAPRSLGRASPAHWRAMQQVCSAVWRAAVTQGGAAGRDGGAAGRGGGAIASVRHPHGVCEL